MFDVTLKRPLAALAVSAGLLVAAAPAGASPMEPADAPRYVKTIPAGMDYILLVDGVRR